MSCWPRCFCNPVFSADNENTFQIASSGSDVYIPMVPPRRTVHCLLQLERAQTVISSRFFQSLFASKSTLIFALEEPASTVKPACSQT